MFFVVAKMARIKQGLFVLEMNVVLLRHELGMYHNLHTALVVFPFYIQFATTQPTCLYGRYFGVVVNGIMQMPTTSL